MARDPTTFSKVSTGYTSSANSIAENAYDMGFISGYGTNLTLAGTAGITGDVTLAGELFVTAPTAPAAGDTTSAAGAIAWDADYLYICTSANSWRRAAIAEY